MAEARSAMAGTEASVRRTEQLLQWHSSCKRRALVMVAGDGGGAEEAVEAGAGQRCGGVLPVAGDVDMGRRSRR